MVMMMLCIHEFCINGGDLLYVYQILIRLFELTDVVNNIDYYPIIESISIIER